MKNWKAKINFVLAVAAFALAVSYSAPAGSCELSNQEIVTGAFLLLGLAFIGKYFRLRLEADRRKYLKLLDDSQKRLIEALEKCEQDSNQLEHWERSCANSPYLKDQIQNILSDLAARRWQLIEHLLGNQNQFEHIFDFSPWSPWKTRLDLWAIETPWQDKNIKETMAFSVDQQLHEITTCEEGSEARVQELKERLIKISQAVTKQEHRNHDLIENVLLALDALISQAKELNEYLDELPLTEFEHRLKSINDRLAVVGSHLRFLETFEGFEPFNVARLLVPLPTLAKSKEEEDNSTEEYFDDLEESLEKPTSDS